MGERILNLELPKDGQNHDVVVHSAAPIGVLDFNDGRFQIMDERQPSTNVLLQVTYNVIKIDDKINKSPNFQILTDGEYYMPTTTIGILGIDMDVHYLVRARMPMRPSEAPTFNQIKEFMANQATQ